MTNFWLRDNLYRDTAPVHATKFVTGDKFPAPIKLVPRPRQHSIKFVPGRQKHVPYPPCTGTAFWLKYLDSARCLRRVTRPRGRLSPSLKQPTVPRSNWLLPNPDLRDLYGRPLYARSYCRAVSGH